MEGGGEEVLVSSVLLGELQVRNVFREGASGKRKGSE